MEDPASWLLFRRRIKRQGRAGIQSVAFCSDCRWYTTCNECYVADTLPAQVADASRWRLEQRCEKGDKSCLPDLRDIDPTRDIRWAI